MFKVHNKDARTTHFTPCSSDSIFNFDKVNVIWAATWPTALDRLLHCLKAYTFCFFYSKILKDFAAAYITWFNWNSPLFTIRNSVTLSLTDWFSDCYSQNNNFMHEVALAHTNKRATGLVWYVYKIACISSICSIFLLVPFLKNISNRHG